MLAPVIVQKCGFYNMKENEYQDYLYDVEED